MFNCYNDVTQISVFDWPHFSVYQLILDCGKPVHLGSAAFDGGFLQFFLSDRLWRIYEDNSACFDDFDACFSFLSKHGIVYRAIDKNDEASSIFKIGFENPDPVVQKSCVKEVMAMNVFLKQMENNITSYERDFFPSCDHDM